MRPGSLPAERRALAARFPRLSSYKGSNDNRDQRRIRHKYPVNRLFLFTAHSDIRCKTDGKTRRTNPLAGTRVAHPSAAGV